MILIGICIAAIVICLLGIIAVVIRHFPELALMNVESIAAEKELRVKNKLLLDKLRRNFEHRFRFVRGMWRPLQEELTIRWKGVYHRVQDLEQMMVQKTKPLQQIDVRRTIQELMQRAKAEREAGKLDEAEATCIEVISKDHRNLDAYEALVDLYREKRDYRNARETGRFLIKLLRRTKGVDRTERPPHRVASAYATLGSIYRIEGKDAQALKAFEQAVATEPGNPRFLDLLLKISIIMKRKDLARDMFNRLSAADPENQRLAELSFEIAGLPEPIVVRRTKRTEVQAEPPEGTDPEGV